MHKIELNTWLVETDFAKVASYFLLLQVNLHK